MHRWYDAGVGRWLSQDPIGFAAGDANLYRYVGNGVTNWVDPNGLSAIGRFLGWLNHGFWTGDPWDTEGARLDEKRRQHFLDRKYKDMEDGCDDDPMVSDMTLTEIRMMNAEDAKDDIEGLVEVKEAAEFGVVPGGPPGTTL